MRSSSREPTGGADPARRGRGGSGRIDPILARPRGLRRHRGARRAPRDRTVPRHGPGAGDLGPDAAGAPGPRRRADDPAGIDGADHHRHREGLGGRQGHRARARCRRLRYEAVLGARARLAGARAPAPGATCPVPRSTATCWRAVRSRWTSTGTRSSSGGTAVAFPPKEFELLETFLRAPGRLLTRELLIQRIWGDDYVGDTKTLDVHVKRVRQKIERDPHEPEHLLTVRGLGYKFVG